MATAVRIHQFGGADVLQLDEVVIPEPPAGEVRINIAAFGLNRVEILYRSGNYGAGKLPARIGYEAAGIVDAVGQGVTEWSVGDRVAALFGLPMEQYGTFTEQVNYPADMLVAVPKDQALVKAAASWMMFGTAYALIDVGQIVAGDTVIINAASSSVGIAAIQIANDRGAIPIAVTRGRNKAAALLAAGAAHVIVSDEEDIAARVMDITDGAGARIAFDAVGGAQLSALLSAMAPLGIVIAYGMLAGPGNEQLLPLLMGRNLTLRGFSADLLIRDPSTRQQLIDYVSDGLARGALTPVIDRTFALQDVADAHRYLEGGTQLGKIVVTTNMGGF